MILRKLDSGSIRDGKLKATLEFELDAENFRSVSNARGFFHKYGHQITRMINNLAHIVCIKGMRPKTKPPAKTSVV